MSKHEENKKPEKLHFDVSAAVIRQLGEELVTDEVTAIMELIKNSYDADADWVKIDIHLNEEYPSSEKFYKDSKPGYISIEDNGFGMSSEDIWTKWMKISLSFKKQFKKEGKVTDKGRTPLGEKGVGRLSTQRLGNRLELFTSMADSDKKIHIAFDWDNFDDETSLTAVPVYENEIPTSKPAKGTTLLLTNLKDSNKWKSESWDKFRGQISQMIFPFKEKRKFNVYLKLNGQVVDLDEVNQNVRDNAVAAYTFSLEGNKLTLDGSIKLSKLSGTTKKDDQLFFEQKVLPDFGKDFFSFLTDKKENKKNFLDNVEFSGKKNVFITFKREIELSDLSKVAYVEVEKEDDLVLQDISGPHLFSKNDHAEDETETAASDDGELKIEVANPGDFDGEICDFYFKETDEIESAFDSFAEFKRIVQNQVGVRIFRDGFGIKPYGIDGQDWLKLSSNQTSGGSFYGLRPGNVVGYVVITAKYNKKLQEKTDREGFIDSPYSRNFHRIMDYFVGEINSILEGARRSFIDYRSKRAQDNTGVQSISDSFSRMTQTAARAKKGKDSTKTASDKISAIAVRVDNISKNKAVVENNEINDVIADLKTILNEAKLLLTEAENILDESKIIDEYVAFLQPQIQSLEQQLSDFSELAGLGLTAEALTHELFNIIDRIVEETDKMNKSLKNGADPVQFKRYVEYITTAVNSFRKQLSHIDSSLNYVREKKEKIEINDFVKEIESYFIERFKNKIKINVIAHKNFAVTANKGKLIQVIDNIMLNSEYWLNEAKDADSNFRPQITIETNEPFIKIYDNGKGVEPTLQDRIFQPFISGKPKNKGRGLGLFIIQQLLETMGCDVLLLNEKNDLGRKYIFQINMSNIIEK